MEEEDCASEVLEFSVPSSHGLDLLDLAVDSFRSGIGLLMAERITDAFVVPFEHFGDLDDLRYRLLPDPVEPELEILRRFSERAAAKNGFEVLS